MRTMHTLKSNVQEKVDYYEEDESLIDAQERYYGEAESVSEVDRMTHAIWAGSAAKSEGITGSIKRDDFKAILRGNLPTTNERIRWENPNPENKERLAHDVVLSAPKSISMALHLEGDVRVFDAHMEAVLETLDFIEKEVTETRIQVNGVRSVVHTGNLLAALIPHHTSRDGDMQLHTHMLIMNGTKGPDGVWRSLSHESLASAEWVGSYYRQKLAQKVQGLGYRIYTTKDGFELEGYSRDEIEVFSKRNRAIVREVMSKGLEVSPENKKDAVLTTRKAKSGVGQKLEEVQEQWRAEAQLEGVGSPILDRPQSVSGTFAKAKEEVDSAIRHLSETSVSFSRSDIYAYAFKHIHVKGLEIEHLNQAIAQRNDLITVGNGRMTTVDALEREIETIQKWQIGQGKAHAFMEADAANEALMGSSLNSGQYEAVVKVASATDRHLIIQGLSGVGKTHALGALKQLIEASGQDVEIKGYSPTIKAAQQLQDALGIETSTVESLIRRETQTTPNQFWVIDEAGMVSADQMLTIVNKAEAVGARILLVGDTGQNPSVKAGSPMKSLMYNGATTFRLCEIIRQQNSMQRRAVELIANGQPLDALRVLNEHGYVEEVSSQRERVQAIAQQYLALDLTERSKTLIVTGTNTERQAITKAIREGLKSEGSLGKEATILQLKNQYMSAEEKRRVENFEPGSYIQLLQDYKTTPLVKNKLYQVMGRVGHELLVSSEGGRLYHFDPSKYGDKEIFKAEQFAVAVGDRLRWTASNRKAGQINGAEFTVIGMSEGQLIVADHKGTKIINLNQPLGVDYALVSTSYRAQGQTAKRVIVSATNGPTAAKEPFYVKISRQTHEIKVYAEDIDSLKDWVQRSNAQENPLDLIGEHNNVQLRHDETSPGHSRPPGEQGNSKADPRDPGFDTDRPSIGFTRAEDGRNPAELRLTNDATLSQEGVERSTHPIGEHHVRQDNRSESPRFTARSNSGIQPNENKSRIKRLRANIDLPSGESSLLRKGAGNEGDDRELTRGNRGAHQSSVETSRGKEPNLSVVGATPGNRSGTARNRQGEYRVIGSEFGTARREHRGRETADPINGTEQERNVTPDLFGRAIRGLPALADAIVQLRLQRELAQPLAQLKSTLIEMSEVSQANEQLKAAIEQRRTALDQQKAEFLAEQESVAQTKAALLDMLQAHLAQSKVEVLDTTLQEWQSLRSGAAPLQLSDQAITPSERVELSELLQNYPAQKAIEFAMEEYYQANEQVIDMKSTLKTGIPVFRVEQPRVSDQSTAPPEMTSKGTRPLTSKPIRKPVIEAFWTPDYSTAQRPDHIEARHWEEMTRSGIHPDLIALNVRSLEGDAVYERLLSDKLATMGTGQYVTQPMARLMAQYKPLTEGGWWGTAGVDAASLVNLAPEQPPSRSSWGCFKGDNPRIDQDKTERKGQTEFIKYENPAGTERHLYLPIMSIMPEDLAQKIYDKHGIQPTAAERKNGFWSVVANHPEIPITITEGLKKTLASLSQGQVTIGLAGVNALYRARDEGNEKLPERLLSNEVAIFATPGRSFTFAFDRDAKTSTVFNVRRELVRGVELLEEQGCTCKIAKWKPSDGKGLDDLIVNQGAQAYAKAIANALPTDQEKRTYYRTEYNVIARQVKKTQPDISADALDTEVYLRAIAKGEAKDGDRFLSQSDNARSLDTPQQVAAYIEQVKTSAPQYLQQRRVLEAAQAATQQQQQRELEAAQAIKAVDRAEYMEIAQQVRNEWGNVSLVRVDIEVYLKAGKNGDRVLAQSDNVRTLETPELVKQYIERIHTAAPQYQNAKALYEKLASGIKKAKRALIPYRLDLEIQFQAKHGNIKDLDQILMHSEVTKAFSKEDPIKAQRYIKALGELATLYESLRESPNQDAVNQSIPKLVHKKLVDPEAMRRLREEEELRRRQQERQERQR